MEKIVRILKAYLLPITTLLLLITGGVLWYFDSPFYNYPFIVAVILGGVPLFFRTGKEVLKGKFNVDLIALISIGGSIFVQEYIAGALIVLMLSGGEALEEYAMKKASSALKRLIKVTPKKAHRKNGTIFADIKVEEVEVGDDLLIKPGEIVPVDSRITSGTSFINQSTITGESVPVSKSEGDVILSGSVNEDGAIEAVALRRAGDSTFAKIVNLLEQAEKNKAPINRIADEFGAWFTPIAIVISVLSYIFTHNIDFAYSVFVIATPCPLILATPIAIISGIARAAVHGVIIKTGQALEAMAKVDTLLFDKTGTLTNGTPEVISILSFDDAASKDTLLRYAGSIEQYSGHVLAQSIFHAMLKAKLQVAEVNYFKEIGGKGLTAIIGNDEVIIGNIGLMEDFDIEVSHEIRNLKEQSTLEGKMVTFIAVNQKLAGCLILEDEMRKESKKLIDDLKTLNLKSLIMVTGDVDTVAKKVATLAGINEVFSNAVPQTKLEVVQHMIKDGRTVAMVGDGVNDAPALAAAHAGIAIAGHGESVTSEAGDIVLLVNDVGRIHDLIVLSRDVIRIAKEGIFFGMGLSIIGMMLAAAGILPATFGALAQEVIDVMVIFNSLRVLKVRFR